MYFSVMFPKLTILLTLMLIVGTTYSQYSSPTVMATAGGSGISSSVDLSWTLGEGTIVTLISPVSQATCGFHQSDSICFGDFNFDGQISTGDLLVMLSGYGCSSGCVADLNGDDNVTTADMLIMLSIYGNSCY
jgi:hypothetical protein